MHISKLLGIIFTVIIISSLVSPINAIADREIVLFREADLYSVGDAGGIHVAQDGSIIVLDLNDEIWKVDPVTGDYQDYYGISGYELYDISLESDQLVWWTDASQMFGSLDMSTNQIKYWDLSTFYVNLPNLGPLTYDSDLLWLSEWFGGYNGIFSFNTLINEICLYDASIHAADVIMHEDKLYILDWYLDALLRLDPTTGNLVKYVTGRDIQGLANLQTDGSLLWWTEDIDDGAILSFKPDMLAMTVYNLPAGDQPRNLTLRSGKIWYTNANGSFGRLDPLIASGNTISLSEIVIRDSITPDCKNLSSPVLDVASREPDGTFAWVDNSSTQTEPLIGIQSYSLPASAEPFGIASTTNHIWLTDGGRQKLIVMELEAQPEGFFIYLPLVLK